MLFENGQKIMFTGDSITDAGRTRPIAEGKGRTLGEGFVALLQAALDFSGFTADSEMTYGYCTELLVRLQNKKTDIENFDLEAFKAFLASVGDSVVAFRTDSVLKLHVHTFTPEKVLAHCRTFGEFLTVKIENMSLQHSELQEDTPATAAEPEVPLAV